ncbi:MAG: shikimate dehydrogenase [Myxococcaceae bacterium]|nr:shikimate dehydrogenase [Myxococcaceae bacterium]MBH2006315.1 shikimate dehydrogenase [Myxococcaceae bacterium]
MKRFVLLGKFIDHSLSPAIHREAFKEAGLDWSYGLMPVLEAELGSAVNELRLGRIQGANVTTPYKEAIIPYLDRLSPAAQAIGAVNTLYCVDGLLWGANTDAEGFIRDLRAKEPGFKDRSFLVLGAGGAAKAVQYALRQAGVSHVDTWTRQSLKALEALEITVHCTPGLDERAMAQLKWRPGQVFYDLRYTPEQTDLMRLAIKSGAVAYGGLGMLQEQARLSFDIWKSAILFKPVAP